MGTKNTPVLAFVLACAIFFNYSAFAENQDKKKEKEPHEMGGKPTLKASTDKTQPARKQNKEDPNAKKQKEIDQRVTTLQQLFKKTKCANSEPASGSWVGICYEKKNEPGSKWVRVGTVNFEIAQQKEVSGFSEKGKLTYTKGPVSLSGFLGKLGKGTGIAHNITHQKAPKCWGYSKKEYRKGKTSTTGRGVDFTDNQEIDIRFGKTDGTDYAVLTATIYNMFELFKVNEGKRTSLNKNVKSNSKFQCILNLDKNS